jgi:hypothetical protein
MFNEWGPISQAAVTLDLSRMFCCVALLEENKG